MVITPHSTQAENSFPLFPPYLHFFFGTFFLSIYLWGGIVRTRVYMHPLAPAFPYLRAYIGQNVGYFALFIYYFYYFMPKFGYFGTNLLYFITFLVYFAI